MAGTLVLALIAGAVIGLALGALGGGGSVLAVPALIYLLGFSPASASTAALIIVTATSATALYAHAGDGDVALEDRWPVRPRGHRRGLPRRSRQRTPPGGCAHRGLRRRRVPGRPADAPARPPPGHPRRDIPAKAAAAGSGLGAVTGLLGVGGGFLAVPALVGVLGLRMKKAVGTSLLVITVNSLAALTSRTGTGGELRWEVIAPFAGAAILGAWDGKRLASRITGRTLQRVFAFVLLAVAAVMLIDVVV
ncbi:sulfite exporter TauE/SafE family protein [Streptomyces] [Streptomyces griseus]